MANVGQIKQVIGPVIDVSFAAEGATRNLECLGSNQSKWRIFNYGSAAALRRR